MVSLSLMARLLEAVRPEARLILVGDPEQLASVEAGAVLGDIVGPASAGLAMLPEARRQLAAVTGRPVPDADADGAAAAFGDGIVVLRNVHRHGGAIAALAAGDPTGRRRRRAWPCLAAGESNVAVDRGRCGRGRSRPKGWATFGRLAVEHRPRRHRGGAGRAAPQAAIDALGSFRLLCGHRRGPEGVATWMDHIENWLRSEVEGFTTGTDWYVGRPLIVTENDYALNLYNGDTGVVIESADGRLVAAFERGGAIAEVSPTRLAAVDTVYAMTVHKSQGSQYEAVAFLLPSPDSRVLTRELAVHGGDPGPGAPHRRRPRGVDPGRHRTTDHPGLGPPAGPLGRRRLSSATAQNRGVPIAPRRNLGVSARLPAGESPGLTPDCSSSQRGFRVLGDDEADTTP